MKTPDEVLVFLIRNATPDAFQPVTAPSVEGSPPVYPLHDLLLRLTPVTRYRVPLPDFEVFLGEKFSFERHLRSLQDDGTLEFGVADPGTFYDSPTYRAAFDHCNGLCSEHKAGKIWVKFLVRTHKNEFLERFRGVLQNAQDLGLKERRALKYKE